MSFLTSLGIQLHMDYEGQRRAENIARLIIIAFASIGLVWGYMEQKFSYTVYTLGAGFAVALVLTLPPWPVYRRNSLNWQKSRDKKN